MLLNSFNLILSIVIATCLVILQETMSNMFWLITIDMPVTMEYSSIHTFQIYS